MDEPLLSSKRDGSAGTTRGDEAWYPGPAASCASRILANAAGEAMYISSKPIVGGLGAFAPASPGAGVL